MKKTFILCLVLTCMLGFTGLTNASLIVTGTVYYDGAERNLIYDTGQEITWLDYSMGLDTWYNQMDWAESLSFTINGITYDDWRLPSTVDGAWIYGEDGTTTAGFNITTSEMGYLYYTELGNVAYPLSGSPDPTARLQNSVPFENLFSLGYWSETDAAVNDDSAWAFMMASGFQTRDPKDGSAAGDYQGGGHSAIAIMSGQIQISSVPEPITIVLFGIGLFGIAVVSKSRAYNRLLQILL